MRHGKKFNHLGRKVAHRKAMLSNMAISLIMHKKIKTTVAKAKALRVYVEPLITKSKEDSTHSRRIVFSYLQNKHAVSELFREISPKIVDRPGGYTRILKIGNRLGDNAEMCIIELVDYNENMLTEKKTKDKSTRKRRRGGAKKQTIETQLTETIEDETKEISDEEEKIKKEVIEDTVEEKIEAKDEAKEEKPEPKIEDTKEELKKEESKKEESKKEEPKKEEPKKEESKKEEPKKEEPKKEESKKEEPKKEEPKKEEPKKEDEEK